MPKKIEMWKCELCGETFYREEECLKHEKVEKSVIEANQMLADGATLKEINDKYQLWRKLPEHLEPVTKDHCFVVSHWQCCDKPAYRIQYLSMFGSCSLYPNVRLHLCGRGSWSGDYGGDVEVTYYALKEPHKPEELFVDKR
jgi:hypothetical protein